ncbi:MAG: hypothetical protein CO135_02090 [Candidatus Levybacteria bacterium CG_4_9_14_3_um_filter_35_16]|nr:MAG: hypothetical protein COW87_00840 [Candidatus Levybacteria bacterium CG22_combo_CG10-13_8_21_14_all_35_11]PJA91252.1 MAG: hypothetical protein CO135_02090 [Candidatus Levybacteria bacterium CG_4_9_14_3_um_filter_35_16]PJC54305.1 MAG: hypothetical protein CO028_03250 [Candidatus Levybacteria bacterium CG_4_9_14_0_2_um_filter_35_21]
MKIGIDISQIAYEKTGVAIFLKNLVENLIKYDKKNNYVLFYSSLRKNIKNQILKIKSSPNVTIRQFKIPPAVLDILWNKLHIAPIEWYIGDIDVFITSDWTEPPTKKAKKATILYDLVVYKYPKETDLKIVNTQKRKLKWVKKESSKIFCISNSTAEDAENILNIGKDRLSVIYPGT